MGKRARSREDRQDRRQAILSVAHELWCRSTFDSLTMADVARGAGLAKGTLYLYFPTKEALLLSLLESRLDQCLTRVERGLAGTISITSPEEMAEVLATALLDDEALTHLLVIMGAILEHNIPPMRIRQFKAWLLARIASAGAVLERHMPLLHPGEGVWVLLHIQMLVAGIGQLAHPAPAVARVLAEPGFEALRIDLAVELRDMLAALLRGRAGPPKPRRATRMRKEST